MTIPKLTILLYITTCKKTQKTVFPYAFTYINDRKEHPIEIFLQLRKKNSLFICIFAPDFAKSE